MWEAGGYDTELNEEESFQPQQSGSSPFTDGRVPFLTTDLLFRSKVGRTPASLPCPVEAS